jgi:hypothetical protein
VLAHHHRIESDPFGFHGHPNEAAEVPRRDQRVVLAQDADESHRSLRCARSTGAVPTP